MSRLKLYLRSGWWHCRGTIRGQRIRKSLGTDNREIAKQVAEEYESQVWQSHLNPKKPTRTFEQAALSYLQLDGEHRFVKPVMEHFKGKEVSTIAPADIRHAAHALYPNHSPATRNRQAITPAQAIINHAHELGWCQMIRVTRFPTGKTKPKKPVNKTWLDKFIKQADDDGLSKVGTAILFMNNTAARRKETIKLTGEYFLPEEKIAILKKTKTDEYATAYLTDLLVQRMIALDPQPDKPIFGYTSPSGLHQAINRICKRAGIEQKGTHEAGRHSFGTNAIAGGADVKTAMDAGRWKSASLFLETYVHSDEAGRKIARLLEKNDTKLAQKQNVK